jgi:hypothetical protein
MNKAQAIADIQAIFGAYKSVSGRATARLRKLRKGKLYELWVLSQVVQDLHARGFTLFFRGRTLKFKAGPGQVNPTDGHFEILAPDGTRLWMFVDIEFQSLGSSKTHVSDYSRLHELDIVVLLSVSPNPPHDHVALGAECKCVAKFQKHLIKEALGVRRELSYFRNSTQDSILSQLGGSPVAVRARPPSEFWLAYIDPKGDQYDESPAAFGISLRHLQP